MSTTLHTPRLTGRAAQLAVVVALLVLVVTAALFAVRDAATPTVTPAADRVQEEPVGGVADPAPATDGCHPSSARGRIAGNQARAGAGDCAAGGTPSRQGNFFE